MSNKILDYINVPNISSILGGVLIAVLLNSFVENISWAITSIVTCISTIIINIWVNTNLVVNKQGDIESIKNKINKSDIFIQELLTKRSEVDDIFGYFKRKGGMLGSFGEKIFVEYLNGFVIETDGVVVNGKETALVAAKRFWSDLSSMQERDSKTLRNVRVLHSNDLSVWDPKENIMANAMYLEQLHFIKNGGKIYRIVIGEGSEETNSTYAKVKKIMEDHEIEIRYIEKGKYGPYKYDFLHLDVDNFALGWKSENTNSQEVSGYILPDGNKMIEIFETWETLYKHLEKESKSFNIPIERQKIMNELYTKLMGTQRKSK